MERERMRARRLLLAFVVLGAGIATPLLAYAQSGIAILPLIVHPRVIMPPDLTPDSFQVGLDGHLNWYFGPVRGSLENLSQGKAKLTNYDMQGYLVLYPGFTAEAANGLRYGVATKTFIAGTGGMAGVSPAVTDRGETQYFYRAYAFMEAPRLGTIDVGMRGGVTDLFQVGTFEDFNDGGWNGDVEAFLPDNEIPDFLFADVGALENTNKIVYVSPSFAGVRFGLAFEPNAINLWNTSGCDGPIGRLGCNRLSSQGEELDYPRRRDTASLGVSYAGSLGPVRIAASASYLVSGAVANTTPGAIRYRGLSMAGGGLTLSYEGLTLGGHVSGGHVNQIYALQPSGGREGLWWLLGAEYQFRSWVTGLSYFQYQEAGNWHPGEDVARTENDTGFAAGATYTIAPGFDLFLSYLYGTRHQAGWNFALGQPGSEHNAVRGQVFAVGTQLTW